MAYSATYTIGDIDDIVIDFVGAYGVQFVAFAGLIALAVLWTFIISKPEFRMRFFGFKH